MTEARELRIGNWVWNEVQQIPVRVNIRILIQQDNYDRYKIGQPWQPIKLTEEWIVKLGFIKDEDDFMDMRWYHHNKFSVYIHFDQGYPLSNLIPDGGRHPQYVHELQNLFHSLTGEELSLNP